jgi:hypothetical protein
MRICHQATCPGNTVRYTANVNATVAHSSGTQTYHGVSRSRSSRPPSPAVPRRSAAFVLCRVGVWACNDRPPDVRIVGGLHVRVPMYVRTIKTPNSPKRPREFRPIHQSTRKDVQRLFSATGSALS